MFHTAFPEREEMTQENETKKTQWHPAFCSAMKLELVGNKKDLDYISEHELNPEMHLWLTSLSKKLSRPTAEKLVIRMNELVEKDEREYADSVLEVVMKANKKIFSKFKEVPVMCEELAKLFEPEMKEATRIAETVGRTEGRAEG